MLVSLTLGVMVTAAVLSAPSDITSTNASTNNYNQQKQDIERTEAVQCQQFSQSKRFGNCTCSISKHILDFARCSENDTTPRAASMTMILEAYPFRRSLCQFGNFPSPSVGSHMDGVRCSVSVDSGPEESLSSSREKRYLFTAELPSVQYKVQNARVECRPDCVDTALENTYDGVPITFDTLMSFSPKADVTVACERFVRTKTEGRCFCAVAESVSKDSEKCSPSLLPARSASVILFQNGTAGSEKTLCVFDNFTEGSVSGQESDFRCRLLSEAMAESYVLSVVIPTAQVQSDDVFVDCRPACLNDSRLDGLHNAYIGMPIQFALPDTKDVSVSCEEFSLSRPLGFCSCTINREALDSASCWRTHPVSTVTMILKSGTSWEVLCTFHNYTTGEVRAHQSHVSCFLHPDSPRGPLYTLVVGIPPTDKRLGAGAVLDCVPRCINTTFDYGYSSVHTGMPIQIRGSSALKSGADTGRTEGEGGGGRNILKMSPGTILIAVLLFLAIVALALGATVAYKRNHRNSGSGGGGGGVGVGNPPLPERNDMQGPGRLEEAGASPSPSPSPPPPPSPPPSSFSPEASMVSSELASVVSRGSGGESSETSSDVSSVFSGMSGAAHDEQLAQFLPGTWTY